MGAVEDEVGFGGEGEGQGFAGGEAGEKGAGREEVAAVVETAGGLFAVPEVPPPGTVGAELAGIGEEAEGNGAGEGADGGGAGRRLDADVPAATGGEGVEAVVGDERGEVEVDGEGCVRKPVGEEGRVGAMGHPEATLQMGVGEGEDPDGKGAFQAELGEVPVTIGVKVPPANSWVESG